MQSFVRSTTIKDLSRPGTNPGNKNINNKKVWLFLRVLYERVWQATLSTDPVIESCTVAAGYVHLVAFYFQCQSRRRRSGWCGVWVVCARVLNLGGGGVCVSGRKVGARIE